MVAGDAMQLKPGDVYQTRWQEVDESDPDTEIDSLLDLSSRYLMNVQLMGHYRSKSLELIDFSNQYFYGGNLQLLPDMKAMNQGEPAIRFEQIEGNWENNINQLEADYIATLIDQLIKQDVNKEIGVITFNAPQQFAVLDAIEN
ncbi:MAG: hypothetical protein IPJ20_08495 [Flammeovirgaceae bacterium]|nr:hypothetical protein [Flammeovirgaceae bacterium]